MSQEAFVRKIYAIRNEPVVLDSDLALLYGVTTGNFNKDQPQQASLSFGLFVCAYAKEFADLIFQIGRSKRRGRRRSCD